MSTAFFSKKLLQWYASHIRELPWKQTKAPYSIWLSEVIMQQTRVEQGMPYYLKFIKIYPTIKKLAAAKDDEVMKLWQGLGYYSRARNLLATARLIVNEHNAIFPNTYESLLKLKGIGPYSAAAIASFAFDLPHSVVDGNVYRVLGRVFGIYTPIDSSAGKKEFSLLANELIDKKNAAAFNQAIMDLGATVCMPRNPKCDECCFQKNCVALRDEKINLLPVKEKRTKVRSRYFHFLILERKKTWLLQQRMDKDIWQSLYQFPMIETDTMIEKNELEKKEIKLFFRNYFDGEKAKVKYVSAIRKQQLSHQTIYARFYFLEIENTSTAFLQTPIAKIKTYAFPRMIQEFLDDKNKWE